MRAVVDVAWIRVVAVEACCTPFSGAVSVVVEAAR